MGSKMECAGKGIGSQCVGPTTTRICLRCKAVSYCSFSHQISHWIVHKVECERLQQQMEQADSLNDFPFTFSLEATIQVCEKKESRCSFLMKRGIHQAGMWMYECSCGTSVATNHSRFVEGWSLTTCLCPCRGPSSPLPEQLNSWKDYYEWRCIPLDSPVAILLHWPLTIYQAYRIAATRNLVPDITTELNIHYLGADMELSQLAVFGELHALFPRVQIHVELVGPAIPQFRDGEKVDLYDYAHCTETNCSCKNLNKNVSNDPNNRRPPVTLGIHKGYYHDRYRDIAKNSLPHIIVGPNAGIAAFKSWLPTIELIKKMNVPAVFSDYCEEASNLAACCISNATGFPLSIPIQLNPFRQPMEVEDSALYLPCYSNCFLFGL